MLMQASPSFDDFASGHLVVNQDRKIAFCNSYVLNMTGNNSNVVVNSSISQWYSKASNIFIDSYVFPMLLNEGEVQEVQLNWRGGDGQSIPVVANIKLGSGGQSFWSIYICVNRNKLQSELLSTKEKLEKKAEELFHLATTDPLTGLLNRREMTAQTQALIEQAQKQVSTFAILCIDVDFFKRVNDSLGHQAGDRVLKTLAGLLQENRHVDDIVARAGGEEFVLIMADIDEKNAFLVAEKLRKKIAAQSIENVNITVSIGLLLSKKEGNPSFEMLLHLSDKALFDSKRNGRNMTTLAKW